MVKVDAEQSCCQEIVLGLRGGRDILSVYLTAVGWQYRETVRGSISAFQDNSTTEKRSSRYFFRRRRICSRQLLWSRNFMPVCVAHRKCDVLETSARKSQLLEHCSGTNQKQWPDASPVSQACESALLRRLWLEAVSVARGGAAAVNACRRRRRLLAKGGGHYLVFYDARAPGSEAAWRGGIVKLGTNTRVSTSIAGVAVARQGDSVFAGTSGLGGCFTGNSRR